MDSNFNGTQFISENLIHVNTLDHDEVLSRYQLDGTIFCIDIDSSNTVLNDLRKKMNKAILERVANSTPKQRETLSRWLLCFEFYALDEGNKMYKLEGTEKAEQFSHQMIQANRMAVFKTQDKKTKSEEATKIKKKRRKSIVGADKLKKDVGGHVQASLEKTDSSSIWKQTSKRTVIQIIYKIGPNRWNFDVNYPPNRVYVGGHYDIFIKVDFLFFFYYFFVLSFSLLRSMFYFLFLSFFFFSLFSTMKHYLILRNR